jgi:hypothetical protein
MNLTRAGDEESLSLEAAVSGDYHLTVRVGGLATLRGTYRLEAVVQSAATTRDKQRLAAESLMIEAEMLSPLWDMTDWRIGAGFGNMEGG